MRTEQIKGLNKAEISKLYPILLQKVNTSGKFGEVDTKEPLRLKIGWSKIFQGFFEIKRTEKDSYDLTLIY